jgi:hypothetical protein
MSESRPEPWQEKMEEAGWHRIGDYEWGDLWLDHQTRKTVIVYRRSSGRKSRPKVESMAHFFGAAAPRRALVAANALIKSDQRKRKRASKPPSPGRIEE